MALVYVCPYCTNAPFSAPSEVLLSTHVRLVHSSDPNFSIQCSCWRTFSNFRTYQNHRRSHSTNMPTSIWNLQSFHTPDVELNVAQPLSVSPVGPPSPTDITAFSAKWILKTCETRCLTRKATVGIVQDVSDLLFSVSQSLQDQVHAILSSNNVEPMIISEVKDVLDGHATSPFEGLTTFHQQLQYYRDHFGLIVKKLK